MRMHLVDWAICGGLVLVLVWVALIFRRFGQSVSGFLAANRCAGRYLLCVASNMSQVGIITLVWFFQQYYDSGWTSIWWGFMENPSMIALAITGWVVYRFRETRALTLAQFFEERYSRSFRIFCGALAFVAGVVNYAIFPAVSARFFMGMCGFPDHFQLAGWDFNTFHVIMAVLLTTALSFVFLGGQIVVMVIDFLQGVYCNAAFLVIILFCIVTFGWVRISDTMLERYWEGHEVTYQVDVTHTGTAPRWDELVAGGALGPDAALISAQATSDHAATLVVRGRPKGDSPVGEADKAVPLPAHPGVTVARTQTLLDGKPSEGGPPPGRSMVHPFGIQNESNFNIFYWMISAFILFYAAKAWQGGQGYNAAALTPHEAKMAQILSGWRWRVLMLVALVVPVCVKVFMHHPDFAAGAQVVSDQLHALMASVADGADSATAKAQAAEMRTPFALGQILPIGMLGLTAAALLGAYVSTDDAYLHSWGAILVQDVVVPLQRKPMNPRVHLWLLRIAITGVAVFAYIVGIYYKPGQYIAMYATLSASMFVAGAGVCIIGGLYWRYGTTLAAWTAMLTGMACSAIALLAKEDSMLPTLVLTAGKESWWSPVASALLALRQNEWLSGQVLGFAAIVVAVTSYVGISLATVRVPFELDRILHRGKYRDEHSSSAASADGSGDGRKQTVWEKLGFTSEFTGADKWVTWVTLAWPLAWTVVFLVFTGYNLIWPVSDASWMVFWKWWTNGVFVLGIVIVVWFAIGGFRDLVRMYRHLTAFRVDERDDGTVAVSGDEMVRQAEQAQDTPHHGGERGP